MAGNVFKKAEADRWICRNCGYVHEGTEAPEHLPGLPAPAGLLRAAGRELLAAHEPTRRAPAARAQPGLLRARQPEWR